MKAGFVCTLLTMTSLLAGHAFAATPAYTFDELADKWSAEKGTRSDQATAIETEKRKIETEATPMYTEQKQIEEKQKPFVAEKERIDGEWAKHNAGKAGYMSQCLSHKFQLPQEKAAYDSCVTLHSQREQRRLQLIKEEDENTAKLKPLLDRWMKLDTDMEPHKRAWRDLDKKLKAVEKEIRRLDGLLTKNSQCNALRDKARNTGATLSQLDRETLHLCESVRVDGANPNLLLGDTSLAALDPNLPPLNWKPTTFRATPNK